jgi:hypothetical protein
MDVHDQPISANFERNYILPEIMQDRSNWQIGNYESKDGFSEEHKTPRRRTFKKLLEGTDYLAEQLLKGVLIRIYDVSFQTKFLIFTLFRLAVQCCSVNRKR